MKIFLRQQTDSWGDTLYIVHLIFRLVSETKKLQVIYSDLKAGRRREDTNLLELNAVKNSELL